MPGPNPILSLNNTFIGVTNYAGYTGTAADGSTLSVRSLEGIPLTTSNGTTSGQIVVAARIFGPLPVATGSTYASTVENVTANGSIPAGAMSWSLTALSGTVAVEGDTVPVGATVSGGGYPGYTMDADVNYTITAGSALVAYDTVAS